MVFSFFISKEPILKLECNKICFAESNRGIKTAHFSEKSNRLHEGEMEFYFIIDENKKALFTCKRAFSI